MNVTDAPLRLTKTVAKGGCAAKIAAGTLRDLLATLPRHDHPDLLVGHDLFDDAAVWRVSSDTVMIQTLDFFTPVVDDPADFGAIAAANALSDVFAMGGEPVTALTILAYPLGILPDEVLQTMMAGAAATIREAGAHLVGGHSIEDDTLKLGFSVTGLARPERLWRNSGARPGDAVVLTKPLGTGTLAGARKNDEIDAEAMAPAIASMRQVNRLDLPDDLHAAVSSATDVTGFGLLGHALHIAEGSSVSLALRPRDVPLLPGARETLERGILTKAHRSTTRYVAEKVAGRDAFDEATWWSLVDPQTSGGLLLCVAPDAAEGLLDHVRERFPHAVVVGEVVPAGERPILLR
jgi:selenide, water dikinase